MGAPKHTGGIQTLPQAEKCCQQCYTYGGNQIYSRASKHMGASKYMGGVQTYGVIQTYGWCPNMEGMQTYRGCPNIGAFKHTGAIQTYRVHPHIWGHPNVWGHMDTSVVWHSMLSTCCVCTGCIQTSPKHTAGYSNIGGIQLYGGPNMRGIQTYMGHPNVWGHMHTPLVWQSMLSLCCVCMGASKHTGGVQTYR